MNRNITEIIKTVKEFYSNANQLANQQQENAKTYAQEIATAKNLELNNRILSLKSQAIVDVRTLAEAAEKEVKASGQLRGKDVTDDIKLLTAGIKLTEDDLQDIVNRNAGNETMLRAIKDYASKARMSIAFPAMAADKLEAIGKIRTGALNIIDGIATDPTNTIVGLSVEEYGNANIFNIV